MSILLNNKIIMALLCGLYVSSNFAGNICVKSAPEQGDLPISPISQTDSFIVSSKFIDKNIKQNNFSNFSDEKGSNTGAQKNRKNINLDNFINYLENKSPKDALACVKGLLNLYHIKRELFVALRNKGDLIGDWCDLLSSEMTKSWKSLKKEFPKKGNLYSHFEANKGLKRQLINYNFPASPKSKKTSFEKLVEFILVPNEKKGKKTSFEKFVEFILDENFEVQQGEKMSETQKKRQQVIRYMAKILATEGKAKKNQKFQGKKFTE